VILVTRYDPSEGLHFSLTFREDLTGLSKDNVTLPTPVSALSRLK